MTAPDIKPGQRFAQYVVKRVLRADGAITSLIADAGRGDVVLRVLSPALNQRPDVLGILQPIQAALGRMLSGSVATIVDIGTDPATQCPYFARTFINGTPLGDVRLSPPLISAILSSAAQSLDAAHAMGLFHHALKPSNILVGADGSARITDFGTTGFRSFANTHESFSHIVAWLSPEQLQGGVAGVESDIFSLALVTFSLLAYGSFWSATDPAQIREQVLAPRESAVARAQALGVSLPGAVDFVMKRALAIEPKDRYPTAYTFATALTNALATSSASLPAAGVPAKMKSTKYVVQDDPTLAVPAPADLLKAAAAPPENTSSVPVDPSFANAPMPHYSPNLPTAPNPVLPSDQFGQTITTEPAPPPQAVPRGWGQPGVPMPAPALAGPQAQPQMGGYGAQVQPPMGGYGAQVQPPMGGYGAQVQPPMGGFGPQGQPQYGSPYPGDGTTPSVPVSGPPKSKFPVPPIVLGAVFVVAVVAAYLVNAFVIAPSGASARPKPPTTTAATTKTSATTTSEDTTTTSSPSSETSASTSASASSSEAAKTADITFVCTPACDSLKVDDKPVTAGKPATLDKGQHRLVATKDGYTTIDKTIDVDGTGEQDLKLEAAAPATTATTPPATYTPPATNTGPRPTPTGNTHPVPTTKKKPKFD